MLQKVYDSDTNKSWMIFSTLFCVLPGMNFLVEQNGSDQHDNFSQDG